jgi:hypothetical protein
MKLSNQNIFNLRGCKNFGGWCQMPLGVCANHFWGGAPSTLPHSPPENLCLFRTWKRNWQVCDKLVAHVLKSDLKSTIKAHNIFFT